MNIKRYAGDASLLEVICDNCLKRVRKALVPEKEIVVIDLPGKAIYLCPSCLQTLRSKIDALSILVQTGINTKEEP